VGLLFLRSPLYCVLHSINSCSTLADKKSAQEVRIIGGKWRGRKLRFAGNTSLRPTLGRTRETLFNWLRPHLRDFRCLDLFAGSGVLGFEALSQGASSCVFIDQNHRTTTTLQACATELDALDDCQIIKTDAPRYLARTETTFDLIFIDPPFTSPNLLEEAVQLITTRNLCRGFIYLEAANEAQLTDLTSALPTVSQKATHTGDAWASLVELAHAT
jgi:16S rRNA (guanine966-N2)-methyltransferase